MRYVKSWTIALSVMFIFGCSSAEPPPPAKTVFEPMMRDMERAREVQKTVDDQADKTRKEIDNQERGDTHP
jgi:hypothetical protein